MTTAATTTSYQRLIELTQEGSLIGATGSILGWDHETMMPEGGLHSGIMLACERSSSYRLSTLVPQAFADVLLHF